MDNEPNFPSKKQLDWVNDFMSNALEMTPDDEAIDFLIETIGLSKAQAEKVMEHKEEFLTKPVFELTLDQIS